MTDISARVREQLRRVDAAWRTDYEADFDKALAEARAALDWDQLIEAIKATPVDSEIVLILDGRRSEIEEEYARLSQPSDNPA